MHSHLGTTAEYSLLSLENKNGGIFITESLNTE
jgi:hypothetical protein